MSHLQPGSDPHATSTPAPKKSLKPRGSVFIPRTVTAPIAALIMAGLLYTYSVSSIKAAKRNAQLHREADGGQLDMRKESLRRHGLAEKIEGTTGYELFRGSRSTGKSQDRSVAGKPLKEADSPPAEYVVKPRTEVEGSLESLKGTGALERYKKEKYGE